MLLVQDFLKNKSFGDLVKDHGTYSSFSKCGKLFSLNYDQIEARENDPLSQQCRGLILSKPDGSSFLSQAKSINNRLNYDHIVPGETKIVACPMFRFFNHGQGSCAEINWNNPGLAILEKLDGTCTIVYKFNGSWNVATRSVPEADIPLDNGIFTFRTLFEKALFDTCGKSFDDFTKSLDENYTYCFELCTPYNRIVVNYPNNRITLLAVRDLRNLKEVDFNHPIAKSLGIPCVQAHTYTSVNELVEWVSTRDPSEHEGVVVRDSNFNRIKVKSAAYCAYSRLRDSLGTSERNCLQLILLNKEDDAIPFLPEEIANNLIKIKINLQKAISYYDGLFSTMLSAADVMNKGDRKTFALLATFDKSLWQAPLFKMYEKRYSMKEFILNNKKDGTWSTSFLDQLLEISKKFY